MNGSRRDEMCDEHEGQCMFGMRRVADMAGEVESFALTIDDDVEEDEIATPPWCVCVDMCFIAERRMAS